MSTAFGNRSPFGVARPVTGGAVSALDSVPDVDTVGAADEEVLTRIGAQWVSRALPELAPYTTLATRVDTAESNISALTPNASGLVGVSASTATRALNTTTQTQIGRVPANTNTALGVGDRHVLTMSGAIINHSAASANLTIAISGTPGPTSATSGTRNQFHGYTIPIPNTANTMFSPFHIWFTLVVGSTQTNHVTSSELWVGAAIAGTATAGSDSFEASTTSYQARHQRIGTQDIGLTLPLIEVRATWSVAGASGTDIGIYQHQFDYSIGKAP